VTSGPTAAITETLPLSNSELLERVRVEMDSLNEKTEVKMFVSNFAVNFEKAMKTLDREEAELAQLKAGWARVKREEQDTKDELAEAKARWAREAQELAAAREEIERLKRGN
jgi:endonuclease YncB( thermonuclease family)